jgi:3-oxo-5alpha-steroid 4-dehydrogenase
MKTPSTLRRSRDIPRWNVEADVLVVGLGCAGASAALEAAAGGAAVVVAERASAGGGTSALSGGVLDLGGSPL